ncbi:MAG: RNA polymerase sigma factor [Actinomycetota bacterium]|nr:RNA polymerase sigma factor [Actinomycetota bacterium]
MLGAIMPDDLSDAEVIERSLAEPAAFAEIFDRHYRSIFRYLVRRLGHDTGEDLAAEVFLRAYGGRHTYNLDIGSARPWLYGIAANLVRMESRRRHRDFKAWTRFARWRAPPPDSTADIAWRIDAIATVQRVGLVAALNEMSEGDREVLLLHALGDLSHREIGDVLSIPVGTVKSRLSRVRATLRELIDPDRRSNSTGVSDCPEEE